MLDSPIVIAVFWLSVVAGPAMWIWGMVRLAGTDRNVRFALIYPVWVAFVTATALAVGRWQPLPSPDTAVAGLVLLATGWLVLVGPVAAVGLFTLIRRWR